MTTLTQRMNVVEENLQSIRLTLDTLLQNLLNPALMVPGTLRFGGNAMQLDQHGIQVRATTSDTASITFVDTLVASDPSAERPSATLFGEVASPSISTRAIDTNNYYSGTLAVAANGAPYSEIHAFRGTYAPFVGVSASTAGAIVLISGQTHLISDITPSQIVANTNDYSPTNLEKSTVLRLSTDASRDITGITGGEDGRILFIYNVGGFNIVLKNDVTSTAANRFLFPADITLAPNEGIGLMYDSTSSRWRCFGRY